MYLEKYEPKDGNLNQNALDVVKDLAELGMKSYLIQFTICMLFGF